MGMAVLLSSIALYTTTGNNIPATNQSNVLLFANTMQSILGLVPARGGSKGISRKNARKLGERYLLDYTAEAARKSGVLRRIVLSTDDPEIAEIGRQCGLEIPFVRPTEIARDETPMLAVVQHAVRELQQSGESFDAVCLLQPTSPLRSAETVRRCVASLLGSDADSVVSVRPVPHEFNPHWVYFMSDDRQLTISTGEKEPIPSRQELPAAYHRDGSVFIVRTEVLMSQNSLYGIKTIGVISPAEEACDLDTEEQWAQLKSAMRI